MESVYKLSNKIFKKKSDMEMCIPDSIVSVYSFPRLNTHTYTRSCSHTYTYAFKYVCKMCVWRGSMWNMLLRTMGSWCKLFKTENVSGYRIRVLTKSQNQTSMWIGRLDKSTLTLAAYSQSVVLHSSWRWVLWIQIFRIYLLLLFEGYLSLEQVT